MKKSKIKLLTAAACLALVGTASAACVYAGSATESANIGVKVAAYASAGEITVSGADNVRVYLDNGSVKFVKEDPTIPFTATYTAPDGLELDSNKKVELTYQVVISSYLSNMVVFASGVTTDTDNSNATDWSREWTSESEILEYSDFPEFAWKSNYESGSVLSQKDSYITLIGMIAGQSVGYDFDINKEWDASNNINAYNVTINFKAEVVDN